MPLHAQPFAGIHQLLSPQLFPEKHRKSCYHLALNPRPSVNTATCYPVVTQGRAMGVETQRIGTGQGQGLLQADEGSHIEA